MTITTENTKLEYSRVLTAKEREMDKGVKVRDKQK